MMLISGSIALRGREREEGLKAEVITRTRLCRESEVKRKVGRKMIENVSK